MRLERNSDFLKLWTGQTISEIGSRISREGIPLTAVYLLGATPSKMGILAATGSGSILLFGLAAGVFVDRHRKRPILIGSDIARAILLGSIFLAAWYGWLSFNYLLLIAASSGALTVLFDAGYQAYLPTLIDETDLLAGNRRLGISASIAEILGPAMTGLLVTAITAPRAILLDAVSFLISAASLLAIRHREIKPRQSTQAPVDELLGGLRLIASIPMLRWLAMRAVLAFSSMGLFFCLYILYAIRTLGLQPLALGVVITMGGLGSLLGAWISEAAPKRIGVGPSFFLAAVVIGLVNLLVPAASLAPRYGAVFLGLAQFLGDGAWMLYVVNETTLRQRIAPPEVQGRISAAMQMLSRGMLPFGALAGGFLADRIGIPATLWLAAAGVLASALFLLPLRRATQELTQPLHSLR